MAILGSIYLGNFCENLPIFSSLWLRKLLRLRRCVFVQELCVFFNFNFFSGFLNPCKLLASIYSSTALDLEVYLNTHIHSWCPSCLLLSRHPPGGKTRTRTALTVLSGLFCQVCTPCKVASCLFPLSLYYLVVRLIFY